MLLLSGNLTVAGSLPIIGTLNTVNTLYHGQACTLTGLQFTGTPGTITLIQGGLSQVQSTGVSWADTSISFTANTSIFAYGPIVIEITNASGTAQANVMLVPVSGKAYVTANVPWPAGALSVLEGADPAVVDGDQIEYAQVTNNGGNVTMFADGTFTIDDGTQSHTFAVRVFDQTDKTWSASVNVVINYVPVISIVDPVDTDGTVVVGQVGAVITGTNFGVTQGTLTIGGTTQVIQSWTNTQITFIVNASTPVGSQPVVVTNAVSTATVSVTVAAVAGQAPAFLGPQISVAQLTQNSAMTSVPVAARFTDPVGKTLTFSAVGAWPAGLIVTAASGLIQGTPTVAGTFNGLSVRATNTDGLFVDSNTFTITVAQQVIVVTPPDPPPVVVNPPTTGTGGTSGGISDVLIANRALTKLGATRIISFGDDTKEARAIASLYDVVRDAELRRRKWRFSLKRAELPALANSPDFGYAYAYQIPADCLSILSVGDVAPGVDLSDYRTGLDMGLYQLEGRTILTDLPAPLKLRYKARITDPTQFDLAFVEALAARIAMELAEDLTQSAAKREQAGADYKLALREAVAANAIEVAPEILPDDSWILSRI